MPKSTENKTEKPFFVMPIFCGFYESWLSSEFDSMVEQESEYYLNEVFKVPEAVNPELWDCWQYGTYERNASEHWLDAFKTWGKADMTAPNDIESLVTKLIDSLEYESTSSPKFYNFETDKLYVTYDAEVMAKIWTVAFSEPSLRDLVRERHSSSSGFVSFYPSDLDEWPAFSELDHNHLSTLFMWILDECGLDPQSENFLYEFMEGLNEVARDACDFNETKLIKAIAESALDSDELEAIETAQELEDSNVFKWLSTHLVKLPKNYDHFQSMACGIIETIMESIPKAVLGAYDGGLESFARCPITLDLFNTESFSDGVKS